MRAQMKNKIRLNKQEALKFWKEKRNQYKELLFPKMDMQEFNIWWEKNYPEPRL